MLRYPSITDWSFLPVSHGFVSREGRTIASSRRMFPRLVSQPARPFGRLGPRWRFSVRVNQREFSSPVFTGEPPLVDGNCCNDQNAICYSLSRGWSFPPASHSQLLARCEIGLLHTLSRPVRLVSSPARPFGRLGVRYPARASFNQHQFNGDHKPFGSSPRRSEVRYN